jgi:hypothetical protein
MSNVQNNELTISPIFSISSRSLSITLSDSYRRIYYPESLNFSLGIGSSYFINKNRISTELSLLYHSFKYDNNILDNFWGLNNDIKVKFNLKYLKIPLGFGYRILNNTVFKIDLNLGVSLDFLLLSYQNIYYCFNCDQQKSYMNHFAFSTYLGTKFKINVYKKVTLTTQPTLDFYMNGFDKIKPNRILVPSIYFGVGYTFTSRKY